MLMRDWAKAKEVWQGDGARRAARACSHRKLY